MDSDKSSMHSLKTRHDRRFLANAAHGAEWRSGLSSNAERKAGRGSDRVAASSLPMRKLRLIPRMFNWIMSGVVKTQQWLFRSCTAARSGLSFVIATAG